MRNKFEIVNFWGRPLQEIGVECFVDGALEFPVFGSTDARGVFELDHSGGKMVLLGIHRFNKHWMVNVPLEDGVHDYVIRTPPHALGAILWVGIAFMVVTFFCFARIPYDPQIRLIDAETEEPIPFGSIRFTNDEGQRITALGDSNGIVTLHMGHRPLYKAVYQLNDSVGIEGIAPEYLVSRSRLDLRTWYWRMDWPLARNYDTTIVLLAWDVGFAIQERQLPVSGALFTVRDLSQPDLPLQEVVSDNTGVVEVTLDQRHRYQILASHPNYMDCKKVHPALSFAHVDTARFELTPKLPCSGSRGDGSESSTIMAYDMKAANVTFCFRAGNDTQFDDIWVTDEHGHELYRITSFGDDRGLGVVNDNLVYEEVLLQSPTRFIYVHTHGNTNWNYEVSCPGETCRPGVYSDNRFRRE